MLFILSSGSCRLLIFSSSLFWSLLALRTDSCSQSALSRSFFVAVVLEPRLVLLCRASFRMVSMSTSLALSLKLADIALARTNRWR